MQRTQTIIAGNFPSPRQDAAGGLRPSRPREGPRCHPEDSMAAAVTAGNETTVDLPRFGASPPSGAGPP